MCMFDHRLYPGRRLPGSWLGIVRILVILRGLLKSRIDAGPFSGFALAGEQ